MNELEALHRKHQEIVDRCDLAVQEADYYRKQHKSVLTKCNQLVREAQALRGTLFFLSKNSSYSGFYQCLLEVLQELLLLLLLLLLL